MRVDEIEARVRERQALAVRLAQVRLKPLLSEVLLRERDGGGGEIDAGHHGAATRESDEIRAGAAPDVEHAPAAIAVEIHEAQQVMQLLEVVLVEIGEEARRADRMLRDLEVVDVLIPVFADAIGLLA